MFIIIISIYLKVLFFYLLFDQYSDATKLHADKVASSINLRRCFCLLCVSGSDSYSPKVL